MQSNQIFNELKNDIIFFRIKPGEMISEIELTKRFKVSRTPIRDIIKRLECDGFVEVRPQKGTFVTGIDVSKIYEIMYLREIVEINVARSILHKATEEELEQLELCIAAQLNVINNDMSEDERAEQFLEADDDFHRTLFAMANKLYLWDVISKVKSHYYRVRYLLNLRNRSDMNGVVNQHLEILNALKNKDEQKLTESYHTHIYEGLRDLRKIMEKYCYYFTIKPGL